MKTLKKTLCLVLAVVMAVGVLVLPANAAMEDYEAFQDTEKITPAYEEAVATLTGMGIITGKSAESFDPKGGLNRAEAATLIVRAITTPATRELLVSGAAKAFTDLDDSYAMKFVNYAAEKGIVNGKGNGFYMPNDPVTYAELGKMLLEATGYEVKNPSTNFKVNVTEFLLAYGLVDTVPTVEGNLDKPLTREEACQMIWIAIRQGVEGSGYKYVVRVPVGPDDDGNYTHDDVLFDSLTEAYLYITGYNSALKDDEKDDKAATFAGTRPNTEGSIADKNYGLDFESTLDDYGRASIKWYNSANSKQVYSFLTPNYTKEYNNKAVTLKTVLKDLGYKDTDKVSVYYRTDGATTPTVALTNANTIGDATNATNLAATLGSGKGVMFEVYNDASSKTVSIVVVNTYVTIIDGDNIDKDKDEITVEDGLKYKGVAGFKDGDVVIYTKNASKIVTLTHPQSLSGKVTSANVGQGYIKVEGATKYVSTMAESYQPVDGKTGVELVNLAAGYKYNSSTVYHYYEDFYGNIIYAALEAAGPAVKTNRIFIYRGATKQYGVAGVDELTGDTAGGNTAYARAYAIDLETNTKITIDIAIAADNTGKTYHFVNPDGTLGAKLGCTGTEKDHVEDEANDPFAKANGGVVEGVYEYVLRDDGKYAIDTTAVTGTSLTLKKNKADAIKVGNDTYYVNRDTVVKVIQYTEKTETVGSTEAKSIDEIKNVVTYNGYDKFPDSEVFWETGKTDGHKTVVIYEATDAGILTSVTVITTATVTAPSTDVPVNYAVFAGLGETSDKQEFLFYVNGELVTYTAKTTYFADLKVDTAVGGVYNITIDGTTLTDRTAQTVSATGTVELVTEDYFVLKTTSGSKVVSFGKDCSIVDGEDDYALTTLTVGDTVLVYWTTADVARFVVVDKNAK